MIRNPFALLILVLSVIAQPVHAQDNVTEAQLERLVREAPKLHLPKLIEFTEAKLDRVYRAKLEASDPKHRQPLEKAQSAWRSFYEADRIVGALDTEGGSGQAVFAMERRLYQLRLRIYQLRTPFEQGWVQIPKVDEPPAKR